MPIMHPMYQQMIDKGFTQEEVVKAGYFEDDAWVNRKDIFNISNIILPNFNSKTIIVGLSGCFAPIHKGHINILEAAKKYFLLQEYEHVIGILWPAHDSYVATKPGGKKWDIKTRLHQIDLHLALIHWIYVDTLPAIELPCDINFPFIIDRLQLIGEKYNADTAFAFGADNSNFAYAFSGSKTKVVCVDRYNKFPLDKSKLVNVDYHEIENKDYYGVASSKIRKDFYK